MKTSRLRIIIATAIAAIGVTAATAPGASAAKPSSVKAGSTGKPKLDDICRQMADVINNEIAEGVNAESNGDFGAANAWYEQASDHTSRAQSAGCVMSLRAPRVVRFTGALARVDGGGYTVPTRTAYAKKISGTAGGGKGQFDQGQCNDIAGWVNDALKKSADAAAAGDAGLAAGWRQHANDLLAAGRAGGCTFYAAIRIGNQIKTTGRCRRSEPHRRPQAHPGRDHYLNAGPDLDYVNGGDQDDTLFTRDGKRDQVDCGNGRDTVVMGRDSEDPLLACEIRDHREP